ncbi:MAG: hypothetical protein QOE71_424 [Pseudonocardiales bacterium]|nr:hypothetical protein [Pseudonocardiales bacterium]
MTVPSSRMPFDSCCSTVGSMTAGDLAVREHTLCHRAATFETATDAALHAVLIDNAALSVMDTSELEDMRAALIADGHAYDAAAEAAGVPMADRFAWHSYLRTTRRQQPAEHRRLAEHSDFQSNAPGLPRRIMSRT